MAVGVLRNGEGQVLLTRRHAQSHQGGLWEFPGGKVETGESLSTALQRELLEELGVEVEAHQHLIDIRHDYGDKRVWLDVHEVLSFSGQPTPREAQPMRWVAIEQLSDYEFPAANGPIVQALLGGRLDELPDASPGGMPNGVFGEGEPRN